MWSSPEIVTVIVKSDSLFCTWLHHSKKDILSFSVRAHRGYFSNYIYTNKNSLFTPTYLTNCIQDFLQRHSLKNAYVLLGFSSDSIYENYYLVERESTLMSALELENKNLVWNYCVLDRTSDHTNDFLNTKDTLLYVYGLSRSHLLQYQLAALRTPFNCIFITSVQRALLQLLWSVRGLKSSAEVVSGNVLDFRPRLKSFIELLEYKEMSSDGQIYIEHEIEPLCAAMGLYLLGENYESI